MENTDQIVLGVSLGTRYLGLAVKKQNELVEWRTKAFMETFSKQKMRKIWRTVEKIIERHGVTVVGVKRPRVLQRSEGIELCLKDITEHVLDMNIPLFFYDIDTIEAFHLGQGRNNKISLAEKITDTYPMLSNEYFRLSQSKYHIKIFEAVAVLDLALADVL